MADGSFEFPFADGVSNSVKIALAVLLTIFILLVLLIIIYKCCLHYKKQTRMSGSDDATVSRSYSLWLRGSTSSFFSFQASRPADNIVNVSVPDPYMNQLIGNPNLGYATESPFPLPSYTELPPSYEEAMNLTQEMLNCPRPQETTNSSPPDHSAPMMRPENRDSNNNNSTYDNAHRDRNDDDDEDNDDDNASGHSGLYMELEIPPEPPKPSTEEE